MKMTTTYSSVEKVQYTFTENEILEALAQVHKIKLYGNNISKYEFEIYDGYKMDECGDFTSEPASAKLIIHFEKEVEK